ncbi:MAG: hypothetical protein DRI69_10040 [Bacteroidetes bacterium]|nr:MAG: hypothetical protein DRI69_10040 [Bacteroidota bacterium]
MVSINKHVISLDTFQIDFLKAVAAQVKEAGMTTANFDKDAVKTAMQDILNKRVIFTRRLLENSDSGDQLRHDVYSDVEDLLRNGFSV